MVLSNTEKVLDFVVKFILFVVLFYLLFSFISMLLFMALYIGLIVAMVYGLVYMFGGSMFSKTQSSEYKINDGKKTENAYLSKEDRIEILKEKYANGELSEDEFEKMIELEFSESNKETSKEYNRK